MKLSLLAPALIAGLAASTLVAFVFAWRLRHRRILRKLVAACGVTGLLLTASAVVNDYFDYLPTVGALLGQRAQDQATRLQVETAVATAAVRPRPLAHGLVERIAIPGTVSGFAARSAQVYLPPAWFGSPRPTLPVLELLHGTPGMPEDWTRAGEADVTADRWAAAHGGVAPIIVMADENGGFTRDTECVDGTQGRAETYLTVDVPRWVVAHLGAAADRSQWAIGGSSEGGYCALDLALRHPQTYATFLDLSGLDRPTYHGGALALFGGSRRAMALHTPRALLRRTRSAYGDLAGWFEVGAADGGTTRAVRGMAELAAARGIDAHLVLVSNAHHTWRVWRNAFADAFPWVATRLGAGGA